MKNNIQKPISMIKNELTEQIVNSINQSGLPLCIIQLVIKDLYNDISKLAIEQEKQEILNYNQQMEAQMETQSETDDIVIEEG